LPFDQRPFGLHFAFGVIALFWQSVLRAATSLRAASAVLQMFQGLIPHLEQRPSANTGQMWLLRIGLYEITRPKEQADDWVWIVDHTIQIGSLKCLLVMGCHLRVWQADRRPLEHQDLEVLALEPVAESNGEVVCKQLQQLVAVTGEPRQIVSDRGSDVKSGISQFCQQHEGTAQVQDIAHEAALVVKKELEADERWGRYETALGRSKAKLQQTALAHLIPPRAKAKARYMNLEELVAWGQKTLTYLDAPTKVETPAVPQEEFEERLGWLRPYREALAEWGGVMAVVSQTLVYVRKHGYHADAEQELAVQHPPATETSMPGRVATALRQVVATESAKARPGERLIGSSECLESLIGKGKRLEGQQSKGGFTKMVLGMAAAVVKPTQEYLTAALAKIKVKDVYQWCKSHLGESLQSLRRKAFASPKPGTKRG
jgi:hypothetical protein